MRGFLAGMIMLAVVAGGLDLALTRAAERRTSEQASALLDAPATVDLQGWPVSLRLLLGAVPVVVVQAENVPTDSGVRLESLGVTLRDVRVRLADLAGGRLPADARDGMFTAALDRRGVGQILGGLVAADAIQLRDGVIGVEVAGALIEAEVDVDSRGRLVLALVNAPQGLLPRIAVPLPMLPAGTTVQRVTVRDGLLRFEGVFDPAGLAELLMA
ncbi:MAG: LmeA family phospholipid-binding protein [Egibacteraceae bacterium]